MGKVHGSLARAGKVKSQTPKVRRSYPPSNVQARLSLSPITSDSGFPSINAPVLP